MRKFILLFLLVSTALFSAPKWYKTQIDTGIGNCGPASVAMSIMWADGTDVSVQAIRKIIGWPAANGATGFDDLDRALSKYNVPYKDIAAKGVESIRWLLNWNLVIIVIDASKIKEKNYEYNNGHFVVLSGVSGNNFIVQDPWGGPDQKYNIMEVWRAMTYKELIVVSHPLEYLADPDE